MRWKCYIAREGIQSGPIAIKELCLMWARKEISAADYYFIEGMESWLRLEEIETDLKETSGGLSFGKKYWEAAFEETRIYQYPCFELVNLGHQNIRMKPSVRWKIAGGKFFENRMIAWKRDLIWSRLGSSELFDDGLDLIHPPFAFGSCMTVSEVDREESVDLGVINDCDEKMSDTLREQLVSDAKQFDPKLLRECIRELNQNSLTWRERRAIFAQELAAVQAAYEAVQKRK